MVESPCSWILVYDGDDVGEIKSVQWGDVEAVWVATEQGSLCRAGQDSMLWDSSAWLEAWQYTTEAEQYIDICPLARTACKGDHCAWKHTDNLFIAESSVFTIQQMYVDDHPEELLL